MRKTEFSRPASFLCLGAILCAKIVSAQVCQDTVEGTYSYAALGNGLAGSLLSPSGAGTSTGTGTSGTSGSTTGGSGSSTVTTNTTTGYTNTEVGQLLGGVTGSNPFSSAGTLYFDGAGNIRSSPTNQGGMSTLVGTYVLNADCTIAVTLNDAFGTKATPTTLQGVVVSQGAEIDLGLVQNISTTTGNVITGTGTSGTGTSGTGTSGTGTSGTGTSGTGTSTTASNGLFESPVLITLTKTFSQFCYAGNLTGPYALIGTGVRVGTAATASTTGTGTSGTGTSGTGTSGTGTSGTGTSGTGTSGTGTTTSTSTAQTEVPFYLFGIVQFDGNGNVLSQSSIQSPLSYLRFQGSYTLNPDCTGTMTISGVPTTTTSTASGIVTAPTATGTTATAGPSISLNFVLSAPTTSASLGIPNAGGSRPGFEFSSSGTSQDIFGYGRPQ